MSIPHQEPQAQPDDEALFRLRDMHAPVLRCYLMRLLDGDCALVDEVVQGTLQLACQDSAARDADGRWRRAWLLATARWILADRQQPVPPADTERLRAAVDALPEQYRETLTALAVREQTVTQAAGDLQLSVDTVALRGFLGIKALRKLLADMGFSTSVPSR